MKKKTTTALLIVVGGALLCVAVLRGAGAIDLSYYASRVSASQTTSKNESHSGREKHFSYRLVLKYGQETVQHVRHNYNSLPEIETVAVLHEPTFSGNTYLPFVKGSQMQYHCMFRSSLAPERPNR